MLVPVVETIAKNLSKTDNSIGIDLGISTFATLSNGKKFEAPKPLKQNLKKLAKFQRKFVIALRIKVRTFLNPVCAAFRRKTLY